MEASSFRPRPRIVEPLLYPMYLVQLPKPEPSEQWWVAWYLPDLDNALQVQQVLYERRVTIDPSRQEQLIRQLDRWKEEFACVVYERLGSMEMDLDEATGPVWLLMGPQATTLSYRHVQRYLSVEDDLFVSQMEQITQHGRDNPDLKQALDDLRVYRKWSKQQPNLTKVLGPPKLTTRTMTSISSDHGDSATVVTNASSPLPESPVPEVPEPTNGKRNVSRPQSKSHSRPTKRLKRSPKSRSKSVARPSDTVDVSTPPSNQDDSFSPPPTRRSDSPVEENTATKFNRQALAEANGHRKASPRSRKTCTASRRRVFPTIEQEMSPVDLSESPRKDSDPSKILGDEPQLEEPCTIGQCSVMEKKDTPHRNEQVSVQNLPQQQEPQEPSVSHDDGLEARTNQHVDQPVDTINWEQPQWQKAQQEILLEPIPPVNLPGTTVREKLNSCLNALRKENETVVPCNKIHSAQQAILDFFHSVVHSKGLAGPNDTLPILHVCGAPGSGKSMTVEICSKRVIETFTNMCDEWEVPPRFCFINCSHLQNQSKQDALVSTLKYAETTESNLKRPKNGDDCTRPTTIFILDEIDYLVSKNSKGKQSEQYIQTLLEWASSSQYMVGVLGISNSVENEKAARLVALGFPRANKVVFRTYDDADLTRIAITKVGTSVVDEKAIEFLSKKVAGASGDARKLLEILSRSIAAAMEEMSDATLNALHEKPVIKVPHFMKTFKSSTIKYKELVESSPNHEKHILCVCIHLAQKIGSRPLSLSRLLWICQQVFDAFDLSSVSELKSTLERLLDSGLLKWIPLRDDKIRLDVQLDDVESAVEEVLLNQNFYSAIFEKLDTLNVAQWAD